MTKTHDADLCERIRALEERVRELEARPVYPTTHPCWPGCPLHNARPNPYPWTVWYGTSGTLTTARSVTTDSTTYTVGEIT